jgi:hypothetical protein
MAVSTGSHVETTRNEKCIRCFNVTRGSVDCQGFQDRPPRRLEVEKRPVLVQDDGANPRHDTPLPNLGRDGSENRLRRAPEAMLATPTTINVQRAGFLASP